MGHSWHRNGTVREGIVLSYLKFLVQKFYNVVPRTGNASTRNHLSSTEKRFKIWVLLTSSTWRLQVTQIVMDSGWVSQTSVSVWCDFDRALSLICGNKMPTRCNRGFYCRSYCLLNMFRAPLCPSSGAQELLYSGCGLWYFVPWFSSCWSGVELRVMCPVCRMLQHPTPDQQLENHGTKYHRPQPLYNTPELLMMGIVVPETCWESNKTCNKNLCCI